jgi:yecA family protein
MSEFVLDNAATEQLMSFMASPERPEGTLTYHELLGYLFAVANCPADVAEDEWMGAIFDDNDPACKDHDEASFLYDALMAVYEQLQDQTANKFNALPASCVVASPVMENFADGAPLGEWSNGFLIGHGLLEEAWDELPEDIDEEVGACVMVLSFFADKELATSYHKEFSEEGESLEEMAQAMVDEFNDALISYADLGEVLRNDFAELE